MANDGTISSKLQLDGEQQYKKALNDAYRSLKVLRSELKAETAELGRNASEQDKARTKMQSLQKQIQQQEKIVKTLEKALADSKKEYADNAEVQDKWEEKLNKARAALAEMQNALGDCEDGLSKFNSSMKETADTSGQAMQTVVSFNDAMKSIGSLAGSIGGALSGIFTNTVDTMKDMVDEMFSLMSMAWSAAGDWKQIQTIWGGDLESIEKVYTAMGLQGVDASQVTSGIQKFITNVHNGNKDTLAALEQLHISEDQFTSHWDFFVAVMDKASMHKGKGYDLMTALFGDKKGAGMTDLLDNWRDAMNKYQQDYEETGMALSSSEIESLDAVAHKITEIQELWNGIKTNIGAKLSEILNMDQLSDDTLAILRDIGAILNSDGEQRAELVLKLSDDIEALIKDVSAAMGDLSKFLKELGGDLGKSNNPLVRFLGQLISGLGNLLDWLAVHGTEITGFLEKAIPWILQNKILEATTGKGIGDWVSTLLETGLNVAILTKLGKSLGAGAAGELSAAAGGMGTAIGAALMKAVPVLAFLGTLFHVSGGEDTVGKNGIFDENGNITNEAKEYGYSLDANGNLVQGEPKEQYTKESGAPVIDLRWDQGTGVKTFSDENLVTPSDLAPVMEGIPETEEWEELPEAIYSLEDAVNAIQDWWDAYRNAENGLDTWEEEANAFSFLQDVLGDQFGAFWDTFLEKTDGGDFSNMEDIPSDWYANVSAALKNLANDKYRGDSDEDLSGKLASAVGRELNRQPVRVVVQLDGETLMDYVDRGAGGRLSTLFG